MTYFTQIIGFLLAVIGVLFKSLKTDENGKTIHNKYGVPLLTRTGRVVLSLLVLSFVASIYVTYNKAKSDDEGRKKAEEAQKESQSELENVEAQNKALADLVKELYKLSNTISDEQKDNFQSVLTKQEKSGEEIANRIGSSADLLNRRIGSSIDILQYAKKEINRAANPIKDVLVSFQVYVPIEKNPETENYRKRVSAGVAKFLGPSREYRDPEDGIKVLSITGDVLGVSIQRGSSLLPRPQSEESAFSSLNCVALDVSVFRKPLTSQQLQRGAPKGDLSFPVSACIDMKNARYDWAEPYLEINYLDNGGLFFLLAKRMPIDYGNWDREKDTIISVPDLQGAQLVISPRESVDLLSFEIKMSGGRTFRCESNNFKEYPRVSGKEYVCNLPS
jgi:hypothetical protein